MAKKDIFLSLLSGLLLIFSFPRFDLEILAWIGLVPLFLSLRGKERREAFLLSFLTGSTFFAGLLYWIATVTVYNRLAVFGLFILVLYLSLYFGLFGLLSSIVHKSLMLPCSPGNAKRGLRYKFLGCELRVAGYYIFIPSLWISLEFIRSHLFSGFPWGLLGYSQYLNLPLIQFSSFTGVYGVSFLIVLVNVAIAGCFPGPGRKLRVSVYRLLVAGLLVGISLLYGRKVLTERTGGGESVRVAVVQGNIPQGQKWDYDRQEEFVRIYGSLTREVSLKEEPLLIIWPETAVPGYPANDPYLFKTLVDLSGESRAYILLGGVYRMTVPGGDSRSSQKDEGKRKYFNSAFLFSPRGIEGRYDKIHLVPFGEFVPWGRLFPYWRRIILPEGGFEAGKDFTIFKIPNQGKFVVLICYEVIFPHLVRKSLGGQANFIVNITNDAWFGKTAGPYQHAAMTTFRAVENRRPLVRAANTGISLFIDAFGRREILKVKGQSIFTRGTLTKEITLAKGSTLYTRYGDVFAYLCLIVTLTTLIILRSSLLPLRCSL